MEFIFLGLLAISKIDDSEKYFFFFEDQKHNALRYQQTKSKIKIFIMARSYYFIFLLIITLAAEPEQSQCIRLNFMPIPNEITCGKEDVKIDDPCKIFFHVKLDPKQNDHIKELIEFQMKQTFRCYLPNYSLTLKLKTNLIGFSYKVEVVIRDPSLRSAFTVEEEMYQLIIKKEGGLIMAQTYVGFVRGLQTFFQSIQCPRYKYKHCEFKKLPIIIEDKPALPYRGLMIDTSRHFLPLNLIFETIDAMMYNKLNVLHWHIVDEDSFPLILESHPQIAKYASFSPEETYSTKDARQIVKYGLKRGVRVIPELDTPGHASSWGKAPENKGVACQFHQNTFMGPLDVTLDKTYKLVQEVFKQIFNIFPDPIVHLGGDEVILKCSANKTEFLQKEGIQQGQMERHYRRKQHKILSELNPNKKFMYWMNLQNSINIEEGDIVHWWGSKLPKINHQLVISQYGPFYLDMGVGNYLGNGYGQYQSWLDLYDHNIGKLIQDYENKKNVIGAEVCLWSELSNQYVHHTKIWIRSSAFAERVWTFKTYRPRPHVLGRVAAHEQLMNRRGIPTSGATSQRCQTRPEYCPS